MSKLKYKYEGGETPEERLRNLIHPFIYLVATVKKYGADPEIKGTAKLCENNINDILDVLDDMGTLYHKIPMPTWKSDNT